MDAHSGQCTLILLISFQNEKIKPIYWIDKHKQLSNSKQINTCIGIRNIYMRYTTYKCE